MSVITQIFAALGIASTVITLFVFFSGWTTFRLVANELRERLRLPFLKARIQCYYDTRMSLSISDESITAQFQIPATSAANHETIVEATFNIPTGSRKGVLGPSSDPSYSGGFQNAQGTLFGFTSQPLTKSAYSYLFFRDPKGQINIVHDVNETVSSMLPPRWQSNAKGFLRIESILRRTVEFETVQFLPTPRRTLHFLVEVDERGNLEYRGDLRIS